MSNNFNPHLQAAVLEVVENKLVEQQAIVFFINKKNTERHTLCAQREAQSTTLTAYRKSLINECVTGRRRITEADVACSRLVGQVRGLLVTLFLTVHSSYLMARSKA